MKPNVCLYAKHIGSGNLQRVANAIGKSCAVVHGNPTLVHQGLARAAKFHVVTERGNTPLADLYRVTVRDAAKIAEDIATVVKLPVMLLGNKGTPDWGNHKIVRSAKGFISHGPRSNPSASPHVGEVWTDWRTGVKCKVLEVRGTQVAYLEVGTGNRLRESVLEFVATHKGPRNRVNPRGRKNPSRSKKARARRSEAKRVLWSRKVRRGRSSVQRVHAGLSHQRRFRDRGFHGPERNPKGRNLIATAFRKGLISSEQMIAAVQDPKRIARLEALAKRLLNPGRKGRKSGRRARKGPRKARAHRNPRTEKEKAEAVYRMWQDRPNARGRWSKMRGPKRVPRYAAGIGELVEVVYRSNKYDGKSKLYKHRTKSPRPVLAATPDGRDVLVVGGNMKITADGLVN